MFVSHLAEAFDSQNLSVDAVMDEKGNVCPQCRRVFSTSTKLRIHIRSHTGEKPFLCDLCDRGFADSSNLAKHRQRHDTMSYSCSCCGSTFATTHDRDRHVRNKHQTSSGLKMSGLTEFEDFITTNEPRPCDTFYETISLSFLDKLDRQAVSETHWLFTENTENEFSETDIQQANSVTELNWAGRQSQTSDASSPPSNNGLTS